MAKTDEEKPDGLEIISIGKLYHGPLEKKYWSSSRGKDRYPYPVGYGASRTHNGINYKMEILEGLKGPVFAISSTDGQLCSGQTPDIAWESFQKRGCARIKLLHGKRFSCKIDGVELFGFKNPLVQRLLRELVANVSETAEPNLSYSIFCNGRSEMRHRHQTQGTEYCITTRECPDLPTDWVKPQVKGKSRKQKEINVKSFREANHKRARPQDETQIDDGLNSIQSCQKNQGSGNPSTSSASTEEIAKLETVVVVGNKLNNSLSAEYGSQFDSLNSSKQLKEKCLGANEETNCISSKSFISTKEAINLVENKELLVRPMLTKTGFTFSKPVEKEGEASVPVDSQMINDGDLCAPDTLDIPIDRTYDSELHVPMESYTVNTELNAAQMVISEDSVTISHTEEGTVISTANENSEKNDSDPVGQEIAKSMMTVLLPRALPLLKTFSRKKKSTTNCLESPIPGMKSQEETMGTNLSIDVVSPAKLLAKNFQEEKKKEKVHIPAKLLTEKFQVEIEKENVHIPSTDLGSVVPTFEDSTSVAPDSYENDQCESTEYTRVPWFQDADEADRNPFGQDTSILENVGLHVYRDCQQSQAACHVETAASKASLSREIHQVLDKGPQRGDNLITDCSPGFTSPSINDMCVHSVENSFLHEIHNQQKDVKISRHIEGTVGTVDAKSTGAEVFDQVGEKRVCAGTGEAGISKVSIASVPDIANSITHGNISNSEAIICREFRGDLPQETCSASKGLPASDNCQVNSWHSLIKRDSPIDEVRLDEQLHNLHIERSSMDSKGAFCYMAKVKSHLEFVWTSKYNNTSDMLNTSMSCDGKHQASGCNELSVLQSHYTSCGTMLRLQDKGASYHNVTAKTEAKASSDINTSTDRKHTDDLEGVVKLLGCYVHPMPILLVLLRTNGSELYICVLCGYLMEKDKTLFIYKVPINGERRGCPSFIGHASIISPTSRDSFGREITLDSSGLQFTPSGKCLVLLNSIKAPYCRERNVNCPCSACTSICFEKNAVKVVQVKFGYVQVLSKLKTTDSVCCILVCEPSYLVAAEESGRLHLWTMNSTWSAQTEESYLPTSDCMPSRIVEMKRIPNFAALVVGHNAFGEFCLWNISKRILVSKFSASSTSFFQFHPVNLFRCPSQGFVTTGSGREEHIVSIMDKANMWFSEAGANHAFLPTKEQDVAVSLLLSAVSDLDLQNEYPSKGSRANPVGCWSLALLAKSNVILGNALDPRAAVVGASAGYGIAGTCDGHVYLWELSTGTELGDLRYCKGAKVSCIATDDSESGAFAIAIDGGQLQVYLQRPRAGFANQEV